MIKLFFVRPTLILDTRTYTNFASFYFKQAETSVFINNSMVSADIFSHTYWSEISFYF